MSNRKPHVRLFLTLPETPRLIRRVFKAFQYRDFRLMWFGACTSSIGTWMQIVAQGWLIYRLSHSAFLLALDQFLGGIPIFLFSLIGGVIADRVERRKILLGSQYVQMASAGLLTILVATGYVHVWHILCLSFVSGFAQAFGGPAYQALIPTLVEKDDMPNAIALNSIQFNIAVMIGPALAGQALAHLGEKWCFGLNAISFLAPIISLSLIRARFLPLKTKETMLTSLKQGIRFARQQTSMEALIILAFCMTALSMPMRTYFPVFVKDIFHRGPETYGNLLALMGLGSIVGSLTIAGRGQCETEGSGRSGRTHLSRRWDCRVRAFEVAAPEPGSFGAGGRFDDGGFCHGEFAGAVDYHQRNARAGDERLQFRLSRRHADGESVVGMAGSSVYGAGGAQREWILADRAGAVFFAGATADGCALRRSDRLQSGSEFSCRRGRRCGASPERSPGYGACPAGTGHFTLNRRLIRTLF